MKEIGMEVGWREKWRRALKTNWKHSMSQLLLWNNKENKGCKGNYKRLEVVRKDRCWETEEVEVI